jgi:hypothetical protein
MFGVAWNPRSRVDWFAILDSLNPKAKRAVWTFFAAQFGLSGPLVISSLLRGNSLGNLLTAFSKLLFLCSCGGRFKKLNAEG